MSKYELMRLSEDQDDDAVEYDELPVREEKEESAEAFKQRYKEFYSDIKTDIKEDW